MADTALEPPFPAYSGTEPFIFVSYAHKDAATVFPDLLALRNAGYRIWFDEGIDPGNEWPAEIAKAVRRTEQFLVFLSPAAAASVNVCNEIHYALKLRKRFLAVYLSLTELPDGLDLSISSIQAILRHQMSAQNYWRKLEKALPDTLRETKAVRQPPVAKQIESSGTKVVQKEVLTHSLRDVKTKTQNIPDTVQLYSSTANPEIRAAMTRELKINSDDVVGNEIIVATAIAETIYREGTKHINDGADAIAVRRGINKAVTTSVDYLTKMSKKLTSKEEIKQIATVSSGWDANIGDLIANAMDRVGKDGYVKVAEARSMETTLDVLEGMHFDSGYFSPDFVTNAESMEAKLADPYILIYEKKISGLKEVQPILEKVAKVGKPILIIAEEFGSEVLATLLANNFRGMPLACAVKIPVFGGHEKALCEDIAIVTGGKFIREDRGFRLESVTLEDLGRAETVVVGKDHTAIGWGLGKLSDLQIRVNQIRHQIKETMSDSDREILRQRLAKIAGGIAVINIGAVTKCELDEKKKTAEIALYAAYAAIEEGIVPGLGVALLRCRQAVETLNLRGNEQIGVEIVKSAIEAPLHALASTAGLDSCSIVEKVKKHKGNYGYNFFTSEYGDLVNGGVIEAKKLVRLSLEKAASLASVMLTKRP